MAIEALLKGQAVALGQKAIEVALAGDGLALKGCFERVAPVRVWLPGNSRDAGRSGMSGSMFRRLAQLERSPGLTGFNLAEQLEIGRAAEIHRMQTMTAEKYAADRAQRTAEHIARLQPLQDEGRLSPLGRLLLTGAERVAAADRATLCQ
jgi:hypothetical protein